VTPSIGYGRVDVCHDSIYLGYLNTAKCLLKHNFCIPDIHDEVLKTVVVENGILLYTLYLHNNIW